MKTISLFLTLIAFISFQSYATTILVPSQYATIQAGIDASVDGDTVLVADGTYTSDGNNDITFGGRDIVVISENGPNNCIIDVSWFNYDRGFIFDSNEPPSAVLSGFQIIDGGSEMGGGIFISQSSPIIQNCIIVECSAGGPGLDCGGGGLACIDSANATIIGCIISNNSSNVGDEGGGIYIANSTISIIDCEINDNISTDASSAIYGRYSNITIANSTISNNYSYYYNSVFQDFAVEFFSSDVYIDNCIFENNDGESNNSTAIRFHCTDYYINDSEILYSEEGVLFSGSVGQINNCRILGNGIGFRNDAESILISNCIFNYNEYGILLEHSNSYVYNCVFFNNEVSFFVLNTFLSDSLVINSSIVWDSPAFLWNDTLSVDVKYTDIMGGWEDVTNINLDPSFVDTTDFHLSTGSPCIDAGDPVLDYVNEPEYNGRRINMGAYGNTDEATASNPEIFTLENSVNFDDVQVGESDTSAVIIFNNGTTYLQIHEIINLSNVFTTLDTILSIPPGNHDTLQIVFTPQENTSYYEVIGIASNDEDEPVYSLTLAGNGISPVLAISLGSLIFEAFIGGNNPADQIFEISNTGNGTFDYIISENIDWLYVTPMSGGPVPPTATETVSVDISGLSAGNYEGDIIITAPLAQGSPDTVHVLLSLSDPPLVLNITQINPAEFPEIDCYASVKDSLGNLILGLAESNFSIWEDNNECSPITVTTGPFQTSTGLVMDYSGSMPDSSIEDMEAACATFVNMLNTGDRGAIVKFSSEVEIVQPYTDDHSLLISQIQSPFAGAGGGTALYDAIYQTLQISVPENTRKSALIMTDGDDSQSIHSLNEVINYAQINSIPVYVIGLGESINQNILSQIANSTGGELYLAPSSSQLFDIYTEIAQSIANEYLIEYTTPNPTPSSALRTVVAQVDYESRSDSDTSQYIPYAPNLMVMPDSIAFYALSGGSNPEDQTFEIINNGIGDFNYILSENADWLIVEPMSGGPIPPNEIINVSVDISGLSTGIYEAEIVVETAPVVTGSPDTVVVILNLDAQPVLLVEPTLLMFEAFPGGENPEPQVITILNDGGGTFDYTASENIYWLSISQNSGGPVPPSEEDTVLIDITGLIEGRYEGDISITAEGAIQSPQDVHIILDITTNSVRKLPGKDIPDYFALDAPYPNPFNPMTNIVFGIPDASNVSVIVYNTKGQEIIRLVEGWCSPGYYQTTFDAGQLPSGVYFARMTAGNFCQVRKLLLIK